MAESNNNAQFGVEIPPVKGMAEAIKSFDTLTESVTRLGNAVGGLENKLKGVRGLPQATGDMQKMQGAASQLLMTMGPLGQQAALLQQRFSGMGAALGGLSQLSAGAVIGISAAVAALLALAAAAMAVKKAFEIMGQAIQVAAKRQMLSDMFADFIGDAKQAEVEMEKLRDLWHTGVFKLDEIVEAATRIRSLGAGVEHTAELTDALAHAAKAGTGDIKAMAEAWASLMAGRIRGAPTLDQLTLLRAIAVQAKGPMETLDAAISRTMLSIKKHEVASEDMAKAILKAAQAGGIFEHEIEEEQAMFEGASNMMAQRWEEFLDVLGEPIIDELTPILLRWADTMEILIDKGGGWGEAIAALISHIDKFVTALDNLIARLEKVAGLMPTLKALPMIGPIFAGLGFMHDVTTPEPGPGGIPKPAGIDKLVRPGPMPGKLGDWIKTHEDKGGGESAFEKYKADLQLLSDFWEEYTIIQAKATTATEAQYRSMQLVEKIIPTLGDPLAHLNELMKGLGPSDAALVKWKVLDEVATRTLKHIEDRAKANQATMAEVWQAGLKKMTDSWGSFQTQMINGIGEIGNALVSDISGGLVDILNGTKSLKDGFRDMALAIVQDIERIVLKLLVQLAIQQLINAVSGGLGSYGEGSSVSQALGPTLETATAGMAGGGFVPGSGRGDKVPALLEPGEFVIPRDSAERIGYGRLEQIRSMAAGGRVQRMAEGGFITGAIGPHSEFHDGQVVFIPGIGEVHLTDYGPGVTGIDIPVSNRHQMFSNLVNRDVMVNGVLTHLSGYIPGNRAADPKGGGNLDAHDHRIIRMGDTGGGRRAGPLPDPFTGKHRAGRPGDPGGVAPRNIIGFDSDGNPITFDDLSSGPGNFGLGDIGRGDRPGFPTSGGILAGLSYHDQQAILNASYFNVFGKSMDEMGNNPNARATVLNSQALRDNVAAFKATGGGGGRSGGPTTGPTGFHATGREWWSGDFGRDLASGRVGAGPGDLGGRFGQRGTGFGSGTVGNWATAIWTANIGRSGGVNIAGMTHSGANLHGRLIQGQYMPANFHPFSSMTTVGAATWARYRPGITSASFETGGGGPSGGGRPMRQNYDTGGVVDTWGEYQSGGTVKRGEGVFTPEQMASLGPAGGNSNQVNQITIAINNQGGRVDGKMDGTGLSDKDAREMARAMLAICKAQIEKEKHVGGSLYQPRSQRGG